MPWSCSLNSGGGAPTPTERVLLKLRDAQGVAWDLSLPADPRTVERFPAGAALTVVLKREPVHIFVTNWLLTIHDGSGLAMFVMDAQGSGSFSLPESGLTFARGEMTCPYSVPGPSGCSSAQFAASVTGGGTQVSAPCGSRVGEFIVTAFDQHEGQSPLNCGGPRGFCDGQSRFQASGLRQ